MKEENVVVTEVTDSGNVTHKFMIAVSDYPVALPLTQTPVIVGFACFCPAGNMPYLVIESITIDSVEIVPSQKVYKYKGISKIDLKQAKTDFVVAAEMLRARFPKV